MDSEDEFKSRRGQKQDLTITEIMKMRYFSDLTKNPALWRGAYWSGFNSKDADADIIRARDWLEGRFGLTKRIPNPFLGPAKGFDHDEFYRTDGGGILMLTSPYEEIDDRMSVLGFERLARKIYHPGATSYWRLFADLNELRRWHRRAAPYLYEKW